VSILNNKQFRDILSQLIVVIGLVAFLWYITTNLMTNIDKRGITTGFAFFSDTAGFGISESPIFFDDTSTYFRAFLVGLSNTLIVSVVGIFFASLLGLIIGVARLSHNFLISKLATIYVEFFRNIPILLQILFWYNVVLAALPSPRGSIELAFNSFLNNRGLYVPKAVFENGFLIIFISIVVAIFITIIIAKKAKKKFEETGKETNVFPINLLVVIALPLFVYNITGGGLSFDNPHLQGFNFIGGMNFSPEFLALTFALSIYTATYISEAVRSGIQAVAKGQKEAAASLGLTPSKSLRLVVLPQAIRIAIPPVINQFLNLVKNSSLATAIGYPELVTVFSGTVLNQTGQAIEIILVTMAVYLTISLSISMLLNYVNKKMEIKGR